MNTQYNMHLTEGGGDDDRRIYFPSSLLHILLELGASFMNTKITSENILIFYINNSLIIIKILFTF